MSRVPCIYIPKCTGNASSYNGISTDVHWFLPVDIYATWMITELIVVIIQQRPNLILLFCYIRTWYILIMGQNLKVVRRHVASGFFKGGGQTYLKNLNKTKKNHRIHMYTCIIKVIIRVCVWGGGVYIVPRTSFSSLYYPYFYLNFLHAPKKRGRNSMVNQFYM